MEFMPIRVCEKSAENHQSSMVLYKQKGNVIFKCNSKWKEIAGDRESRGCQT